MRHLEDGFYTLFTRRGETTEAGSTGAHGLGTKRQGHHPVGPWAHIVDQQDLGSVTSDPRDVRKHRQPGAPHGATPLSALTGVAASQRRVLTHFGDPRRLTPGDKNTGHTSQNGCTRIERNVRRTTVDDMIPLPPDEMRALVGVTEPALFDNASGSPVLPAAGERSYGAILDFGCGCGRLGRQFLQQDPRPTRYLGIDLHPGMIRWCQNNLAPISSDFEFVHHDVFNAGFNPTASARMLEFPADTGSFDAIVATSVFTHLIEDAAVHYLHECARVLKPDGALVATWFLFEKRFFPMMQASQNALYINLTDPSNAAIFDRSWFRAAVDIAGLTITAAVPPAIRGFHWTFVIEPSGSGKKTIDLPEDRAPFGSMPPPVPQVPPHLIGTAETDQS